MVFIVKDLLVSVLVSDDEENAKPAMGHPTTCLFNFPRPGEPATMAGLLEALKAQLERALSEIDREEQMVGERLQPRTLEQIDMLATNLDQAREELERLRTELGNEI